MADDLRRFVTDLRALRESRGVSLQRIQSDTRIPLDVLRQFEDDGLDGNRTFNRVYLRSLVRTYSQSIGVPVDTVMRSLDAAFEQRYTGPLLTDAPEAPASDAATAESRTAESGTTLAAAPLPPSRADAAPDDAASLDAAAAHEAAYAAAPAANEAPYALDPAPVEPGGRRVVETGPRYEGGPVFDTLPERPGLPSWAYGLLALLGLALLAGGVFWWMGRTPAPDVPADDSLAADTLAAPGDTALAAAPQLPATLPAELRLTVTATGGPLAPVRVMIDTDDRRPYWIDGDSSRVFTFRDSVRVFELKPTSTLAVEGAPVPPALRQPDGTVRIRRSDLQR